MPRGVLQWLVRRAATMQTPLNVQDAVLLIRAIKSLNVARSGDRAAIAPETVRTVCEKAAFTLAAEPRATQPAVIVDLVNTLATLRVGELPVVNQVLTRRLLQLSARQTPRQTLQKAAIALLKLGHRHGSPAVNDHLLHELHLALPLYPDDVGLRLAYIGLYPYTTFATQHSPAPAMAFPASETLRRCAKRLVAPPGATSRLSLLRGNAALQALHLYPVLAQSLVCDTSASSDAGAAATTRQAWRELRQPYTGQICITSISSHAFAQFMLDFLPAVAHDTAIFAELLGAFVQPSWHGSFNTFDVAKVATAVGSAIAERQSGAARGSRRQKSEDKERVAKTMKEKADGGVVLSSTAGEPSIIGDEDDAALQSGDAPALCMKQVANSGSSAAGHDDKVVGTTVVAALRVCVTLLRAFLTPPDEAVAATYTSHGATLAAVWQLLQRCCRASQLGLYTTQDAHAMMAEQLPQLLAVTRRALDAQHVALSNMEERLLTSNGMVWVLYSMADIYCTVPASHDDIAGCLCTLVGLVHRAATPTTLTVRSRVQLLYALARLMRTSTQTTEAANALRTPTESGELHVGPMGGNFYANRLEEWCAKELRSTSSALCGHMSSGDACMLLRAVSHAVHAAVMSTPARPAAAAVATVMPASLVVLAIECVRRRLSLPTQRAESDGTTWVMCAVVALLSLQALPAYRVEAAAALTEMLQQPNATHRAVSSMTLEQCGAILRELQWLQGVGTAGGAESGEDDADEDELRDNQAWSALRERLLQLVCDAFAAATARHLLKPFAQPPQGSHTGADNVRWLGSALQCCEAGLQLGLPLVLDEAPRHTLQQRGLALSVGALLARPVDRLRATDAARLLRLMATQVMRHGPQAVCSQQHVRALRECALADGSSSSCDATCGASEVDAVVYLLQANQHMVASTTLFDDAAVQRLLRLTTHHFQVLVVDEWDVRTGGPASRHATVLLQALVSSQLLPRCGLHSLRTVPPLRDAVKRISQALGHDADPQHQLTIMTAQLLCDDVSAPSISHCA